MEIDSEKTRQGDHLQFGIALRGMLGLVVWGAAVCAQFAVPALGQPAWRPDKAVEFITPSGAGASNDQIVRLMQKILQDARQVPVPINIMNKPGGNQTLAVVYLNQFPGNGHYLLLGNSILVTNQLSGLTQFGYLDLTPVSLLLIEHNVVTVRADSPLRSLRDLMDRYKADPAALAFAGVSLGGSNNLTFAAGLQAAGADARKMKMVVFKSNGESMTALLGGHVHAVLSSASAALPQVQSGNARILAVAATRRMSGALASVPTFREQGIDALISNWRGMFGPKGMTAAQVGYWDDTFAKMTDSDDWKKDLEAREWGGQFLRSREFAKYLEGEYHTTRSIMSDLGQLK